MKMSTGMIAAAAIGLTAALSVSTAQAVLVDNLNSGSLSAYTQSRVNDGNTTTDVSFSNSTGDLRSAYATGTTSGPEQVLLLRNDFTLPVGSTLIADGLNFNNAGFDRDIGIAVGYTSTPTALATGGTGDVRSNFVEVSLRSNNQVVSYARDTGNTTNVNLASGQFFTGAGSPALTNTDPIQLYVTHTGANTFEVGFYQNNVKQIVQNYTFTGTNVPGAAVGFYTDLRAPIASSPSGVDNLQIITGAVPEPASLALLGLGGMAVLRRRRSV